MNIFPVHRVLLIGFMGSGKSTVGRKLAEQLGWRFEDIDEAITHDAGMSIAEIFQDSGAVSYTHLTLPTICSV